MSFYTLLENENNYSETENGALGYATTHSALLDLNFATSSLRNTSEDEIVAKFKKAWDEDKSLALRWLLFLRDIRGGMGERRSFRTILAWLGKEEPQVISALLQAKVEDQPLIAYFGRWDDIFSLLPTHYSEVVEVIRRQLNSDINHAAQGKAISLLAKWMPSVNTSSKEVVFEAKSLARALGMSEGVYRKTLSKLRRYLRVVEQQMSAREWGNIDYSQVPSKANLLYSNAFMRHDTQRRNEYLQALSRGEASINAGVLYPYDIFSRVGREEDTLLDEMWKSFKDGRGINKSLIVVSDGSGSMTIPVSPQSSVRALDVAASLALYFAETLQGEFANKFITFSRRPQLVDVGMSGLHNKKAAILKHTEVANTNIEAVFNLILDTAVKNHLSPEEMPEGILIISDMEFDDCARDSHDSYCSSRLFDEIGLRYQRAGYQLPRLIFWNVCSRSNTIPLIENDLGVTLVSGFGVQNIEMLLSGDVDPLKALLGVLLTERYDCVTELVG